MGLKDNEVRLTIYGWLSAEFVYLADSFKITPGAKYSLPPKVSSLGKDCVVHMSCERSGSTEIAQQFLQTCAGRTHVYSPSAWSDVPEKLNFFFGLTSTFTDPSGTKGAQVIYLAQGHMGARNNWWIGGPCVISTKHLSAKGLLVAATPPEIVIYDISGSVSTIELKAWRK